MSRRKNEQLKVVDMKAHILNVAASLMLEQGITQTSLHDIAKAAGISKGTLYYYYSAKDDIIFDIANTNLTEITTDLISWINNVNETTELRPIVKELFERILAAETRAKLHLYLLNEALTSDNTDLKEKFTKRYEEWRSTLKKGLDALHSKQNNIATSYLIIAALDGLSIQKACGEENLPIDDILDIFFPNGEKE